MANLGVKISKDNIDVKTGSNKNTVLTSKYSILKGTIAGNSTASFSEGTEKIVTIAHNLGYIPSVTFLVNRFGVVSPKQYQMTPYYDSGALYQIYYYAYADSTNIYLVMYLDFSGSSTVSVDYIYRIYLDKGKL